MDRIVSLATCRKPARRVEGIAWRVSCEPVISRRSGATNPCARLPDALQSFFRAVIIANLPWKHPIKPGLPTVPTSALGKAGSNWRRLLIFTHVASWVGQSNQACLANWHLTRFNGSLASEAEELGHRSFEPRQSIRQRRLAWFLPGQQSRAQHEQAGKLLGQCVGGVFLQQPEKTTDWQVYLQNR